MSSLLEYLYAEERRGQGGAREALFFTFNVDLGFFETRLLGLTRAAGALVTVIADARMFDPDVRAIRSAGTAYIPGLAATPGGAFHPKVNILVGEDRTIISIGSGNLTLNGWHLNDELCTVITGDREQGCPDLVVEVADWLRGLDQQVRLSPAARPRIHRTIDALDDLVRSAPVLPTAHRLVHSGTTPILEQLPNGPAERLRLYAPFHDPAGIALGALINRYKPRTVTIAVQPGQTVLTPPALVAAANGSGVSLTFERAAGERYRHGKLIEATRPDGSQWALTGSPNLSSAALVRTLSGGGNCEVGVLTEPTTFSLYPGDGTPVPAADVPTHTVRDGPPNPEVAGGVLLLGAVRSEGNLTVTLHKPAPAPITVEVSHFHDLPESYTSLGVIPAGQADAVFDGDFPGGSRIRLTWLVAASVPGEPLQRRYGPAVPLTDPARAAQRRGGQTGNRSAPNDPLDLFGDPRLAEQWLAAVGKLATNRTRVPPPRSTSSGSRTEPADRARLADAAGWRQDNDPDSWARYTDEAVERLGQSIFVLATGGLPRLGSLLGDTHEPTAPVWADRVAEEDNGAVEGDTIEEQDSRTDNEPEPEPGAEKPDREAHRRARTAAEQRRYRAWLTDLVGKMRGRPAIDRAAMHALMLIGTAGKFWAGPSGGQGWLHLLADATVALDGDDIPAALEPQFGSLAAVALYLMRDAIPYGARGHDRDTYLAALAASEHLLVEADLDLVRAYSEPLRNDAGFPIDPAAVMEHATAAVQDDPTADLVATVQGAYPDWEVHAHGPNLLHVHGTFGKPFLAAGKALDLTDALPTVGVWATNHNGDWALAIVNEGTLSRVEPGRDRIVRHYDYALSTLLGPGRIAAGGEAERNADLRHRPQNRPSDLTRTAMSAVAVDSAVGPPSGCPAAGGAAAAPSSLHDGDRP
ncbi:hypothetical protein LY71_1161 [Geodermatophilus tzadiensis]|uniref:Uncharacterized protein n=1 Tax=Geodermatophilus tzadiensis TaxID=1137988 RepID=A0A2T0TFA0_9ACTN|nr:hypothetical protein [Geodermatophilus tzadiensis]PRY44323.1 hypothetical protein LY71_1161 [Geodermatophilus tzadiensis]